MCEQCINSDFCLLHSELMWGYCSRRKKKKKNVKLKTQQSAQSKHSLYHRRPQLYQIFKRIIITNTHRQREKKKIAWAATIHTIWKGSDLHTHWQRQSRLKLWAWPLTLPMPYLWGQPVNRCWISPAKIKRSPLYHLCLRW